MEREDSGKRQEWRTRAGTRGREPESARNTIIRKQNGCLYHNIDSGSQNYDHSQEIEIFLKVGVNGYLKVIKVTHAK